MLLSMCAQFVDHVRDASRIVPSTLFDKNFKLKVFFIAFPQISTDIIIYFFAKTQAILAIS